MSEEQSDVNNVLEQLEKASSKLSQILEEGDESGKVFKYDEQSDLMLRRELNESERQVKELAQKVYELKVRLAEMCRIPKMTDVERDELEEKNLLLKKYIDLFEEKTRRIQFLIGQKNLFEDMISPRPPAQQKYREDMLPRVIICGMTQCCNIPKVIICDIHKRRTSRPASGR